MQEKDNSTKVAILQKISEINWEKVGIYIALFGSFISISNHIGDMRERIAKLEVKIEYTEKGKPCQTNAEK